jgi:hypothetical protein
MTAVSITLAQLLEKGVDADFVARDGRLGAPAADGGRLAVSVDRRDVCEGPSGRLARTQITGA